MATVTGQCEKGQSSTQGEEEYRGPWGGPTSGSAKPNLTLSWGGGGAEGEGMAKRQVPKGDQDVHCQRERRSLLVKCRNENRTS